jgi:hypothetical protein
VEEICEEPTQIRLLHPRWDCDLGSIPALAVLSDEHSRPTTLIPSDPDLSTEHVKAEHLCPAYALSGVVRRDIT